MWLLDGSFLRLFGFKSFVVSEPACSWVFLFLSLTYRLNFGFPVWVSVLQLGDNFLNESLFRGKSFCWIVGNLFEF